METEHAPLASPAGEAAETGTTSTEESGTIFESARGTAVKLLSRYESSDSYIDKLLEARFERLMAYGRTKEQPPA